MEGLADRRLLPLRQPGVGTDGVVVGPFGEHRPRQRLGRADAGDEELQQPARTRLEVVAGEHRGHLVDALQSRGFVVGAPEAVDVLGDQAGGVRIVQAAGPALPARRHRGDDAGPTRIVVQRAEVRVRRELLGGGEPGVHRLSERREGGVWIAGESVAARRVVPGAPRIGEEPGGARQQAPGLGMVAGAEGLEAEILEPAAAGEVGQRHPPLPSLRRSEGGPRPRVVGGDHQAGQGVAAEGALDAAVHPLAHPVVEVGVRPGIEPHRPDLEARHRDLRHADPVLPRQRFVRRGRRLAVLRHHQPLRVLGAPTVGPRPDDERHGDALVTAAERRRRVAGGTGVEQQVDRLAGEIGADAREAGGHLAVVATLEAEGYGVGEQRPRHLERFVDEQQAFARIVEGPDMTGEPPAADQAVGEPLRRLVVRHDGEGAGRLRDGVRRIEPRQLEGARLRRRRQAARPPRHASQARRRCR